MTGLPATSTACTLDAFGLLHDSADGVGEAEHVQPLVARPDDDHVGLLAGRQRADAVVHAERPGAVDRRPAERVAGGERQLGRVGAPRVEAVVVARARVLQAEAHLA